MKIINIDGRGYTFEFSIEASLYNECTEEMTSLMMTLEKARSEEDIKTVVSSISNIPHVAMTLFYAGLLEHHGHEIRSMQEAKALVKTYLSEHRDDEKGNFYSIMNEMMECMSDDGFFDLIGLSQMMKGEDEAEPKKAPKVPQDHKKKAVAATKN